MSKVDAKCVCGDELHVSAWLSANTAAFYEAFMQEHAACRDAAKRLATMDGVVGFPEDGTKFASALDRYYEAKARHQKAMNRR